MQSAETLLARAHHPIALLMVCLWKNTEPLVFARRWSCGYPGGSLPLPSPITLPICPSALPFRRWVLMPCSHLAHSVNITLQMQSWWVFFLQACAHHSDLHFWTRFPILHSLYSCLARNLGGFLQMRYTTALARFFPLSGTVLLNCLFHTWGGCCSFWRHLVLHRPACHSAVRNVCHVIKIYVLCNSALTIPRCLCALLMQWLRLRRAAYKAHACLFSFVLLVCAISVSRILAS